MNELETVAPTTETIETPPSLESNLESINALHEESVKKLENSVSNLPDSPEQGRLEQAKEKAASTLSKLRAAAILSLALNSIPALAETPSHEALLEPAAISAVETPYISAKMEASGEESEGNIIKEQFEEVAETAPVVAQTIASSVGYLAEAKLNEIKDNAEKIGKEESTAGERVDAGVDLGNAVPGLAKKIPLLSIIESVRTFQKGLSEGKPLPELVGDFAKGLLAAKTFGLSNFALTMLKSVVPTENEKGGTAYAKAPDMEKSVVTE